MKLPPPLFKCLCDVGKCRERGRVCWEDDGHRYLHVRVDGCAEYPAALKRADCVILRLDRGRMYAFVVEVKTRDYALEEVMEKLEGTLSFLDEALKHPLLPLPVVYAKSHRWKRYAFLKKARVKYKGRLYPIAFLRHCQSIQRALPRPTSADPPRVPCFAR
jgi:hypothetical protein